MSKFMYNSIICMSFSIYLVSGYSEDSKCLAFSIFLIFLSVVFSCMAQNEEEKFKDRIVELKKKVKSLEGIN